jgi:hypothetical protein
MKGLSAAKSLFRGGQCHNPCDKDLSFSLCFLSLFFTYRLVSLFSPLFPRISACNSVGRYYAVLPSAISLIGRPRVLHCALRALLSHTSFFLLLLVCSVHLFPFEFAPLSFCVVSSHC